MGSAITKQVDTQVPYALQPNLKMGGLPAAFLQVLALHLGHAEKHQKEDLTESLKIPSLNHWLAHPFLNSL